MPLEAGTFIPELNANNPLGADPKSEGDDHLRLIKRCTLGSFPAFVGNAGDPKSVSLTEDQINDAALKSEVQTISAQWTHSASVTWRTIYRCAAQNLTLLLAALSDSLQPTCSSLAIVKLIQNPGRWHRRVTLLAALRWPILCHGHLARCWCVI